MVPGVAGIDHKPCSFALHLFHELKLLAGRDREVGKPFEILGYDARGRYAKREARKVSLERPIDACVE
jgi:hypothetical protein